MFDFDYFSYLFELRWLLLLILHGTLTFGWNLCVCFGETARVGGYCFPKWIYDKIIDKYHTIIPDYKYKNTSIFLDLSLSFFLSVNLSILLFSFRCTNCSVSFCVRFEYLFIFVLFCWCSTAHEIFYSDKNDDGFSFCKMFN